MATTVPSLTRQHRESHHNMEDILRLAARTGIAGASSMAINVFGFMWMRTTMNYQYKNGGTLLVTLRKLYAEGGVVRFYRGIIPALVVGPVARFGDTGCNNLALNISASTPSLKQLPTFIQTSIGSMMVGFWRISTLPFDAWKTSKQVHGPQGLNILLRKFRTHGVGTFYQGGVASSMSSVASHYPWYVTNNYMDRYFPKFKYSQQPEKALLRAAGIGGASQFVSDMVSNWIKVVKTVKQTAEQKMTYNQIFKVSQRRRECRACFSGDSILHMHCPTLILQTSYNNQDSMTQCWPLQLNHEKTKILSNVIQGSNFKIAWSYFEEKMNIPKH